MNSKILSEKSSDGEILKTTQLWKVHDSKANKQGVHNKIYWVKEQSKQEDGTYLRVRWKINNCYQGNWKDNKKCGFGIHFYENGDKYEGDWLDNKRHGYGTYWVKNEKKKLVRSYTGDFSNDKKNGRGTMYFPNGNRYDGYWEEGEMNGFGRMAYFNGDVYVGNWANNERNGYGVFTKSNGDYYEGNWLMDQREGYGSYYFAENRKIIIGEWVNDAPKVSVLYKTEEVDEKNGLQDDKSRKFQKAKLAEEIYNLKNMGDKLKLESTALPILELEDPITLLESAMEEVRRQRLSFRIKNSPVECLMNEEELLELFEDFEKLQEKTSNVITLESMMQFLQISEKMEILEALESLDILVEKLSFEDAVKIKILIESSSL